MKKPKLGQNFLINNKIAEDIVAAADLCQEDFVLEIGPGKCILTDVIIGRCHKLILVEKDKYLAKNIYEKYKNVGNIEVISDDFLNLDLPSILGGYGKPFKVISNLPYDAGTHIFKKLIINNNIISDMVLMFQREVADRISADKESDDYGYLSVFSRLYCEVTKLFEVGPEHFKPAPKVTSAVVKVKLVLPKIPKDDISVLLDIASAAFLYRRKTLENSIMQSSKFDLNKETIRQILKMAGLKDNIRGETLNLEEFYDIVKAMKSCAQ